jgi:hypothetical protein
METRVPDSRKLPFAFVPDVFIRASIQIRASGWQPLAAPLDAEPGETRRAHQADEPASS